MSLPKKLHELAGTRPILRVLKEGWATWNHFCFDSVDENKESFWYIWRRDGFGDVSVLGDKRWAGGHGVCADFIALENSHVAFIKTNDILVMQLSWFSAIIFLIIIVIIEMSGGSWNTTSTSKSEKMLW